MLSIALNLGKYFVPITLFLNQHHQQLLNGKPMQLEYERKNMQNKQRLRKATKARNSKLRQGQMKVEGKASKPNQWKTSKAQQEQTQTCEESNQRK